MLLVSILPAFFNQPLIPTAKASPTPPTPDHQWKFEQNLTDTGAVGGYDLTATPGANYTSSAHSNLGYAFNLNGSNYVYSSTFLDDINTKYGSTGFTLSFWLKCSQPPPGWVRVLHKRLTANDELMIYVYNIVQFRVVVSGTIAAINSYTFQEGVWHHVVAMMASNGSMYLHINNVLQGSSNTLLSIPANADGNKLPFNVGYDQPANRYYPNPIDEIQFFNGLLTDKEREELFWLGVEPVAGQDWTLRGNARLVDRTIIHNDDLIFLNTQAGVQEKYEFQNVTLTIEGSIGAGASADKSYITFVDSTVYFNKTGAGIGGGDKWRPINYTNCKFLNVSDNTFLGVQLGNAGIVSPFLKNVEIRGTSSYRAIDLVGTSSSTLKDVYISQSTGEGIYTTGSNHNWENITMLDVNVTSLWLDGSSGCTIKQLNITWSFGLSKSGAFINLLNAQNNVFENLTLVGWAGANDYPHKAIQVDGSSTNNTFRNVVIKDTGNGFYSSSNAGTINYLYNFTTGSTNKNNNEDGIDSDKANTIVIRDSYIYNVVHGLSVEGGAIFEVYNTIFDCRTFEEQTTYDGDIYPVNGKVYLTNSPVQSIAHRSPVGGNIDIYQQWNFTTTDLNITIHIKNYLDGTKQNINVTLRSASYEGNALKFEVFAPSGSTSIIQVYTGSKGNATDVKGVTTWSYNDVTKMININRTQTQTLIETIIVYWAPVTLPPFTTEVTLICVIAVGTGGLLAYTWQRKKKTRVMKV